MKRRQRTSNPDADPSTRRVDIGRLFDEHAPFLLRVAERLTGSGAHVEDVVQEVFLIAHRKQAVLADHPDPRAWLYRTTANVVQHHRRSIARRLRLASAVADEPVRQDADRPDRLADRRQQAERIRECTEKLPIKQREVFVLFELESMEGTEIAAMLDIPENTVWSRLHHARKGFRKAWERAASRSQPGGSRHG